MIKHNLNLVLFKTYAELRLEITRSYLGIMWWILEPLLYMAAFYIVFELVFKRGGEGFVAFLLTGLVIWKWFDVTVRQSMNAIGKNAGLISQVYLPKYLFPAIVLLTSSVKFFIVFTLLIIFVLAYGYEASVDWLWLLVLLLIQAMFLFSVSLLVAAWVPLIPDIRLVIENLMTMLFFLSGVFFDLSSVTEPLSSWLSLNPMAVLINGYRSVFLGTGIPDMASLAYIVVFSIVIAVAGLYSLQRFDRVYPKLS